MTVKSRLSRLRTVALVSGLPPAARARLCALEVGQPVIGRYRGLRRRDVAVPLQDGLSVSLRGPSLLVDYWTFCDIFVDQYFLLDQSGAVVLDAGAHCGYFGAYALTRGSQAVWSVEPQSDNFAALARTAARFRHQGLDWSVERCAVGAEEGTADLHVSSESWSHSLREPASGDRIGIERVPVRPLRAVMAELRTRYPDHAMVVKLNIEGAAGEAILSTPAAQWADVDQVMFDYEPGTSQSIADVLSHLAAAGHRVTWDNGRDFRLRRDDAGRRAPDPRRSE